MDVIKIIGALFFWAFIIVSLYLKTVETSSPSQTPSVKRNRFLVMLVLWLIAPTLGGATLGALVADAGAPEWIVLTTIALAIVVPWFLAIRLQVKWGQEEQVS